MRRLLSWAGVGAAVGSLLVGCGGDRRGDDDSSGHECGDRTCAADETATGCPEDCPAECGDGACTHDEDATKCPQDCGAVCGDDACTDEETAQSCEADCPADCGDDLCTHDEDAATCPADCDAVCGDDACTGDETAESCDIDCLADCGDDLCTHDEDAATCPADCDAVCGDDHCTHEENAETCEQDCPAECGDDACTHDEVAAECPEDCPPVCGDEACTGDETAESCELDCPAECGDDACTHGEDAVSCSEDCPAVCGDDACTHAEDCASCEGDCGICLPEYVNVELIGALIAPTKADYSKWDGIDPDGGLIQAVEDALVLAGEGVFVEVFDLLVDVANFAFDPPDAFGYAEIALGGVDVDAVDLAIEQDPVDDTFAPQWPGPPQPGWWSVALADMPSVRVTLTDADVVFNDTIGMAEIAYDDIVAAWLDQGIYPVRVDDQDLGRILFLTISVTMGQAPATCNGECDAGTYLLVSYGFHP